MVETKKLSQKLIGPNLIAPKESMVLQFPRPQTFLFLYCGTACLPVAAHISSTGL